VSRRRRNAAVPAGKLAGPDSAAATAYRDAMSDAARTLFLVCYDVCKTTMRTRVRKFLMAYKVGGQKSFIKSLADLAAKDNDAQLRELLSSQGISFSANPQTGPAR
jgi:hypothetical protein